MTSFKQMIELHKQAILHEYQGICQYLTTQAKLHDNDKIEPGYVHDIYTEHFPTLKSIPFATPEYKAYEQEHFSEAHHQHVQNRHHYYDHRNNTTDVDLFDVLEAIVDIRLSQRQYSNYDIEIIMNTFRDKGVLDLDLESVVLNTLIKLEEIDEKTK